MLSGKQDALSYVRIIVNAGWSVYPLGYNDEEEYIWESGACGPIAGWRDTEQVHGETERCTSIICYLRKDQSEFFEERRLKELLIKFTERSSVAQKSSAI